MRVWAARRAGVDVFLRNGGETTLGYNIDSNATAEGAHMEPNEEKRDLGHQLVGWTRYVATVPVVGLFVAAIAMAVTTFIQTVEVTVEVVMGSMAMQTMLVEYIECADYFLLAIVLYIMSIGLYSLFIDSKIKLPASLEVQTLDELKEKLVSVIAVVMGVYFLGRLLNGADPKDLLYMGIGIGVVVIALAYFVHHVMAAHD